LGYAAVFAKLMGFGPFSPNNRQEQVLVPSLMNMTVAEAQNKLDGTGLKLVVKSEEYSSQVPEGNIISQTPSSGSNLNKGDSIEVIVSKGTSKVPVPNVIGLKLTQAEKLLNDNGLLLGNVKYEYNSAAEGTVLSQSLVGGSSDEGQKVSLVVSKGRKKSEEKPSIIDDNSDSTYTPNVDDSTGGHSGGTRIIEPGHSGRSGSSSGSGSSGGSSSAGSSSSGSSSSGGSVGGDTSSGSGSVVDDTSGSGTVVE